MKELSRYSPGAQEQPRPDREPGVGKTAVAEGLAQRITAGNVPEILINKRWLHSTGSLVAGTKYREFEESVKRLLKRSARPGILSCLSTSSIHWWEQAPQKGP